MHLPNPLLHIEANVDFLVTSQFDDGYSQLFVEGDIGEIRDWLDGSFLLLLIVIVEIDCPDIERSNLPDFFVSILDVQDEILFAISAILNSTQRTFAFPRVLKIVDFIANKRYQSDPLTEPLIVEY